MSELIDIATLLTNVYSRIKYSCRWMRLAPRPVAFKAPQHYTPIRSRHDGGGLQSVLEKTSEQSKGNKVQNKITCETRHHGYGRC